MAKYKYDPLKAKKGLDEFFGAGFYESGVSRSRELGTKIGNLKRESKLRKEQERLLEQARKEAAKEEREKKKQKEKEKESGKKETKLSKENENKKKRLKDAGVDPDETRNSFEKATNLEKDQNFFFDALELLDRGGNTVRNVLLGDAKQGKEARKIREDMEKKLGRSLTTKERAKAFGEAQQKLDKKGELESYGKRIYDGASGRKKTSGSDVLGAAGMEKGAARGIAGFGLEVAVDPLNLVGGAIGKGVTATAKGANRALDKVPGMDRVKDGLDEIFSGRRLKSKTLDGGRSEDLLNIERNMENQRLFMQDNSANAVARATREAGDFGGDVIGREMERPLMKPRPLDTTTAPNVMSRRGMAMGQMDRVGQIMNDMKMNPSAPLSRPLETNFKASTVFDTSKILDSEVPNAAGLRSWANDAGFEGVPTKGRLPGFYKSAFKTENRQAMRTVNNVESEVHRIVTRADVPVEQAAKELQKHPSIKTAAQTLINSNQELRQFAEANGMEIADIEGYMAHYLTKEGRKVLDEAGETVSDGIAPIGANKKVMNRTLHDSVENINRKKGMEYFNPDAFVATAGGQHRMINAIVRESVKKQVLGNSSFAKEIPAHKKARKGFVELSIDGKKYEVTRGAKQVMTNFEKNVTDEGIQKILTGFDKLQNAWKKTALFSVGFHARNYIGNSWNMHLSGMRPDETVSNQIKAMNILKEANKTLTGRKGKINNKNLELYDEFRAQGLKGTGSMADFRVNPEDELMSNVRYKGKGALGKMGHEFAEIGKQDTTLGKVGQAADAVFATSRRVGDVADEAARLGMYKWARDKGMSPEKAAAKVRETLFDYTELTPAEQQVFKRMAPFYTWLRKNSEFQMKSFMKDPTKFNRIRAAMENGEDNVDMDSEIVPEYLKENMAIPIPGTDRLASLGLPAADLSKWTDPGKVAMDSLSPLLKVPMELGMNKKTFNGAPISNFEGETKKFLGMDLPAGAAYVGEQIAPLRRLSGTMTEENSMKSPVDGMLKLLGGDLLKKYDQEGFQQQFDYKEKTRLDDLIKKTEKVDGQDVRTLNEMKKAGKIVDEEEAATQDALKSIGLSDENATILRKLKKKVYNGNAEDAAKTAEMLRRMGVPEEAIEIVTSEYLEY
jgi:hypothetical protein